MSLSVQFESTFYCHASIILVLATETLDVTIAVVALYTAPKSMHRQMIHHLCKKEFACVHRLIAPTQNAGLKRDANRVTGSSR